MLINNLLDKILSKLIEISPLIILFFCLVGILFPWLNDVVYGIYKKSYKVERITFLIIFSITLAYIFYNLICV